MLLFHLVLVLVFVGLLGMGWSAWLIWKSLIALSVVWDDHPASSPRIYAMGSLANEIGRLISFVLIFAMGMGFVLFPTVSIYNPIQFSSPAALVFVIGTYGFSVVELVKALYWGWLGRTIEKAPSGPNYGRRRTDRRG